MSEYWYSRWLFERALATIYLAAFIAAAKQFVPLLGEHGLEPVGRWVQALPFRASPSLFYLFPKDNAFYACAWLGVALSVFALSSLASAPLAVSLKCEPEIAERLRATHPAVEPGYHLNKRHWNTVTIDGSLEDRFVLDLIEDSYDLVVAGLPKRVQSELGWPQA